MVAPASQFHTRTNIRDRSLDNFHGDANFKPANSHSSTMGPRINQDFSDEVPPLETVYRIPN